MTSRPAMFCIMCNRMPEEIGIYVQLALETAEDSGRSYSADDYVWHEEGTLNKENGHFLCDADYIKAGMPSAPGGWKAP